MKLINPQYELKQSGNCLQEKLRLIVIKNGFSPLISDNAIYVIQKVKIIMVSCVDDFLLMGTNWNDIQALTKCLNDEVALNDLGDASWFLRVRIRRSSPTGSVILDQQQYLRRSLEHLRIDIDKKPKTPMSPSCKPDLKRNLGKATATELYNF
ncbi:hypothetical protein EV44_g4108 [Erysiphe necator]|uniref:Reverse transcriptase Ty1/copia-type domain-containing protein n=1 Tax=Uncinula necator TaxID=52586 RepID=A0A0B1NZX7_UNCNE|nr:hypothetical protein EV44_g4108 [Erysiphe necator]